MLPTREMRAAAWHKMLALYTDQVFSIGIVNATLQPIVATAKLQQRARQGDSSASIRPRFFGVYGTTPSGSTREALRMLRYILWRIAVMMPTLAHHLGARLHHHRAAARRLFRELRRRACRRRARASTPSRSRRCARSTASTSRRSCATSTGSPACCRAISAIPSNISCRSPTWSATGCG